MPVGPGKYGEIADAALIMTSADGIVLIVLNGNLGSGMSVSSKLPSPFSSVFEIAVANEKLAQMLPTILRTTADEIELTIDQEHDQYPGAYHE